MNYKYFWFLFVPSVVLAQTSSNDFFPLSVGNRWTFAYHCLIENPIISTFSWYDGKAQYTVLSNNVTPDSIIWNFQEKRNVVYSFDEIPRHESDTSYTIIDSTLFTIVENLSGNHKLTLYASENIYPYLFLSSNETLLSRYSPAALQDTLIITEYSSFLHGFTETDTTTVVKSAGVIQTAFHDYGGIETIAYDTLTNKVVTSVETNKSKEGPQNFVVEQNYPNPFNPATVISFNISSRSETTICIYDILGKLVETVFDGVLESGNHSIIWNALNKSSGVYLCVVRVNNESKSIRLVLLK